MRAIDLLHAGVPKVISCWDVDGVLVDPGPQSCEEVLLEALGGKQPRALLLTHIHLDHAGVAGSLVRRWPDLEVHVHERGAPHLADPGKLVASVARLLGGEEELRALWGEVVPVPPERLRVLRDGETVLDDFRVAATPGHAVHHVSYLHEPTGTALVGDTAGVRIPPAEYVMAPTPPPEVDLDAWEASLDLLAAWEPRALAIAHFGEVSDVGPHLAAMRERLHEQALLAAQHGQDAFVAGMVQRVEEHAGDVADGYLRIAPPDQQWLGLDRWHRKRAERQEVPSGP